MAIRLSTGLRNKVLDSGMADAFDTTGRINIYTGTQPASANDAATGTLLATLTLASDSVTAGASSGSISFATITSDTSADASGTAGYGRFYRTGDTAPGSSASASDRRLDFGIAETSGGDVNFDETGFVAGGTVAISSFSITLPSGE
jgi:hypothetical protein